MTKAGSKSDQHAVKRSLQQQIDRSRSMAEMHDHAYSKDVEVIKSVEDGLISVFNKVLTPAWQYFGLCFCMLVGMRRSIVGTRTSFPNVYLLLTKNVVWAGEL